MQSFKKNTVLWHIIKCSKYVELVLIWNKIFALEILRYPEFIHNVTIVLGKYVFNKIGASMLVILKFSAKKYYLSAIKFLKITQFRSKKRVSNKKKFFFVEMLDLVNKYQYIK